MFDDIRRRNAAKAETCAYLARLHRIEDINECRDRRIENALGDNASGAAAEFGALPIQASSAIEMDPIPSGGGMASDCRFDPAFQ